MSNNAECLDPDHLAVVQHLKPDAEVQDCAIACFHVSTMFTFTKLSNQCNCETASSDGSCIHGHNTVTGYDLYFFDRQGKFLIN